MAWAAMNDVQVALPENQVVVPVISRMASSTRRRSISAMSDGETGHVAIENSASALVGRFG